MLDLDRVSNSLLDPIAEVVDAALAVATTLSSNEVMVVGAACRDILHSAMGHTFLTTATRDLDLALALTSWDAYGALVAAFPRVGNTGIRFRIEGVDVDLLPFGGVERSQGVVEPPSRREVISVWAFEEIYDASLPLAVSPTIAIRIPSIAGYAAAKAAAWLDRSDWFEAKDAADLALVLYWSAESAEVHHRLYESAPGNEILIVEGADVPLAAAHMLGADLASTIGPIRLAELLLRWPGNVELMISELEVRGGPAWPGNRQRRRALLDALSRGLVDSPT